MSKLHNETVATYVVNNRKIDVVLCWQGKDPEADSDRFYDLYENGVCLNLGDPWHDDGEGVPSLEEVRGATTLGA